MCKFIILLSLVACAAAASPRFLGARRTAYRVKPVAARRAYIAPAAIAPPRRRYVQPAEPSYVQPAAAARYGGGGRGLVDESPKPFDYGWESVLHDGGSSSASASGSADGVQTGTYTITYPGGYSTTTNWVADGNGYRANVVTNAPGTLSSAPADVEIQSSAPTPEDVANDWYRANGYSGY